MAVTKIFSGGSSHAAMKGCIGYVLQEEKTYEELMFFQGPSVEDEITPENVYESFMEEKDNWDKDDGRMYYHMVISFHQKEEILPEEVLEFGMEYANRVLHDYQTLIVVHEDKSHQHVHFVINSVSFADGHKFHTSKRDLEMMKQETDRLCRERELTITRKGYSFEDQIIRGITGTTWNHYEYDRFGDFHAGSYVQDCAWVCYRCMKLSSDRESFIENMKERGWDTVWSDNRKHITFVNGEGQKVRDSNISKKFNMDVSKESLEYLFMRMNESEPDHDIENVELERDISEPEDHESENNHEWMDQFIVSLRRERMEISLRNQELERQTHEKEVHHSNHHNYDHGLGL